MLLFDTHARLNFLDSQIFANTSHKSFEPLDIETIDSDLINDISVSGTTDSTSTCSFRQIEQAPSMMARDPFIQLYYHNFHASHPFLLPLKMLNSTYTQYFPSFLQSMMRAVGAHYHHDTSLGTTFRESAQFLPSLKILVLRKGSRFNGTCSMR